MNIAIVGATGNVGRKTLEVLEKKGLTLGNLYLVASSKSAGKKIHFQGKDIICLLYTSPSPRDKRQSRMPSSA